MAPGYQIVQSCHAVAEFTLQHSTIAQDWAKISNSIICLSAKTEQDLEHLLHKLSQNNITFSIFREPDIDNQITAIAIEPGEKSRKMCSSLPLAMKNYNDGINKHTFKSN